MVPVHHAPPSFFFIDCRKHVDNQSIILHGRNIETDKRQAFFIDDFFPRMGLVNNEANVEKIIKLESKGLILQHEFFYKEDWKHPYFGQFDENIIVIYLKSTEDVYEMRPKFEESRQADVPYERVFKIDRNIHSGFYVLNFDEISEQNPISLPGRRYARPERFEHYLIVSHRDIIGF